MNTIDLNFEFDIQILEYNNRILSHFIECLANVFLLGFFGKVRFLNPTFLKSNAPLSLVRRLVLDGLSSLDFDI
jgi:hypothetical protein